jgi:hypothetical protein
MLLWVVDKLRTLCGFVGGAGLLGIAGAALLAAAGEDAFPAPLSMAHTGFGQYVLETCGIVVAAFIAWRLLAALGLRLFLARVSRRAAQ